MGYHRKKARASNNIKNVKGFVCPTCDSLVPRGYEVCYNCGDMPSLGSSYRGGSHYASSDDEVFAKLFVFIAFLSPLFYYLSNIFMKSQTFMPLNIHMSVPTIIIGLSSLVSFTKNKTLGLFGKLVRIWIFIFCILILINSVKAFIDFI